MLLPAATLLLLLLAREAALQKAEAEKVTRVKAAEAEAEARYLQGQGISRQRQAIVNGLRDSVADFSGEAALGHRSVGPGDCGCRCRLCCMCSGICCADEVCRKSAPSSCWCQLLHVGGAAMTACCAQCSTLQHGSVNGSVGPLNGCVACRPLCCVVMWRRYPHPSSSIVIHHHPSSSIVFWLSFFHCYCLVTDW